MINYYEVSNFLVSGCISSLGQDFCSNTIFSSKFIQTSLTPIEVEGYFGSKHPENTTIDVIIRWGFAFLSRTIVRAKYEWMRGRLNSIVTKPSPWSSVFRISSLSCSVSKLTFIILIFDVIFDLFNQWIWLLNISPHFFPFHIIFGLERPC